ncbi:MAG: ABC transporter ATP-binding protein [Acidimicrobiia bacterium]|nr:ABC transporter ATP-binding protein [Acidimicrobiia bacterium]
MTMTAPDVADGRRVESVLSLRGVQKTYGGATPVHALRGVDLDIAGGELLAVVGPSGSGKSTLLHIMGTLDRPTQGEVVVDGNAVSELNDRQLSALRAGHIGFVFQSFHLLNGESALENVADGLLYTGVGATERRRLATEALDRVDLGHRSHHLASKLSGGEMQRVAVARAIVGTPTIVLADEPTGNLDSVTSDSIVALLGELNDEGITMVVITHNREIAEGFPRQVGMRDGDIEYDRR